ncbi:hypothetical protein CHS0354_018842 [Potamilus streckersoni]|uniref:VWFD domain-containing protein n=1 Tax=Potamilus streckersoni TaxID=2493646 RepID=A0AAE0VXC8_9BIVA|nr:hypothetical protein CHS0354_018842 [Potamilus streckersoni]
MDGPKPTGDGTAPSVSLQPTIHVERDIEHLMPPFKNKLLFYCNFTPDNDSNLLYTVEWYKGYNTLGSLLYESEPTKFITEHEFKIKTALTEDKMGTIGIHLVCSVMARREKYGIPSTPSTSESFFAGIEVVNKTAVHISTNLDNPIIYIRSTIPFACAGEECLLDINLFVPSVDDCRLPKAGVQASSGCGVAIPKTKWDQPQPLTIALKEADSSITTDPVIMEVYLKTIPRFLSHKIFQNHVLPDRVQVHLSRLNMAILNGKVCHAICDPHMQTFDQLLYENQREGTFVLYSNTDYPAEVQIETKSCYRNNNPPYCPCGVAVRAGRDVFVVNKCEPPFEVRMVQCLDGVLKGKVTTDKKSFTVNLPTGTVVHIDNQGYFETYGISYNVIIEPALTDYGHKNGIARTKGLCGTFDGNRSNDLLKRDGLFDNPDLVNHWRDPSSFNEDWR